MSVRISAFSIAIRTNGVLDHQSHRNKHQRMATDANSILTIRSSRLLLSPKGERGVRVIAERSFIPKPIEVKPVIRSKPGIVLQPIDVALSPILNVSRAPVAI